MNDTILELVHHAMPVFAAFRDGNLEALNDLRTEDPKVGHVAFALTYHISGRQQSATLLVQEGKLWDAEILLRSAAEAVLKLLFICLAESTERESRINEFLEVLPALADLRQSERARIRLSALPPGSKERVVFKALVLEEEEEEAIRAKWPRQVRQHLGNKWSFIPMVEWIDSHLTATGSNGIIQTLLHNYGLSSHLIHADGRGLELVRDMLERQEDVRRKLVNAHAARLIDDMLGFSGLIGTALARVTSKGWTPALDSAYRKYQEYSLLARPVHDLFLESQEASYQGLGFVED